MMNDADIWTAASRNIEIFAQQMSPYTYGFFFHGLCIFGLAWLLCRLSSRGRETSSDWNWFWLILAFVLGPKTPILTPESTTMKVLLLISAAMVIIFAPSRLAVYLSSNEKRRRHIQVFLFALLLVVLVVDMFVRRTP